MICGALDPWNRPYVTRPKEVLRYTPKQWGWVSTKKALHTNLIASSASSHSQYTIQYSK